MLKFLKGLFGTKTVIDPNTYDLRYFRSMTLSDSWDGKTTSSDGWTHTFIFYNGEEVLWSSVLKYEGQTESRRTKGDKFFYSMLHASRMYISILEDVREQYFRHHHAEKSLSWWSKSPEMHILLAHPQYAEMVENFGVVRNSIMREGEEYYTFTATKFHNEAQAA